VPAPLRELVEAHHVDKSTASRWIKEARRRGYIEEESDAR
jgi:DNA-binding MarR family transcriptional regulator